MVAPLRLKREKVGAPKAAVNSPQLSVLVDNGVYHLDQEFDYLLPEKYEISPGDWISVPFKGSNKIGLVTKRGKLQTTSKLLFINKPIAGPKITSEFLQLYKAIAARWAVPIFDVLRFTTKFQNGAEHTTPKNRTSKRFYLQLNSTADEITQLREQANLISKTGPTLIIVPEKRLLKLIQSDKYDVGLRGSILSPKHYLNLVILREDSEHHYEIKSPGFNTRDVALLRSELLHENLYFLGFAPSLEMLSLIEKKYVTLKKVQNRITVNAKPSLQGETIPSALIPIFKKYLQQGTVLVIAPVKGYGLAISCAKCRNVAKCECGGRLTKKGKNLPPNCSICNKKFSDWKCSYCGANRIYLLGRGIDRIAEEFGKSFPNTAIHIATADKEIESVSGRGNMVLSTLGAAPVQIYSAVLFLEGLNLTADLRSTERSLSSFMRYSALSQGRVLIVEPTESAIVNALIQWNPFSILNREVEELRAASLPPSARHILIKSNPDETNRIFAGLQSAIREGRLDASVRIFNLDSGLISIFFPLKAADRTLKFIFELQKRRSMANKGVLKLRVDPYLLG